MQHDERGDPVAHGARLFDLLDSIVSRDFMELGIWIMVDAQSESPPYDHNALQRAVDFLDQQESWQVGLPPRRLQSFSAPCLCAGMPSLQRRHDGTRLWKLGCCVCGEVFSPAGAGSVAVSQSP